MKAMVIRDYGDENVFELEEIARPEPGPGQVLIKVYGSSVNPLDIGIRQGLLASLAPLQFPAILGVDVSGEIVALGERVQHFSLGDRVYAYTGVGAGGGYGEFAVVSEESLAKIPAQLDIVEAGTVPGVGATAFEAFTVHAPLQKGMRVLIHGAAGGVGTYAIQVAKAMGAQVWGVCSSAKTELVSRLGAEVIDYTKSNPFSGKAIYDVILNTVRGTEEEKLHLLLREKGKLVTVVGTPSDPATSSNTHLKRRTIPFFVNTKSTCLEGLSKLFELGTVIPVIEKTYSLSDLAEAHKRVGTGRVGGKVGIEVQAVS